MVINLGPDLEAALNDSAREQGVTPEDLALDALRERFLPSSPPIQPRDEWEQRLLSLAKNCGVSLPHAALGRDELYD